MVDEELFLKELQSGFIEEAVDLVEQCEQKSLQLEAGGDVKSCIEVLFRCFHTIKGTAAAVEMQNLASYTHKIENLLVAVKNGDVKISTEVINLLLEASDNTKNYVFSKKEGKDFSLDVASVEKRVKDLISSGGVVKELVQEPVQGPVQEPVLEPRVNIPVSVIQEDKLPQAEDASKIVSDEFVKLPLSKIDGLIDYLGEQVILQTALNFCNARSNAGDELMSKTIVQLNKITQDLQQSAIALRMFNLSQVFKKAKRLVRDTSLQLGKEINFSGIGENAELDKTIVDELSGPVTHLVRNSVDHGIEDKEQRLLNGKDPVGTVELQAFQRSGFFYLVITDDGKGLDADKIRKKGLSLGLIKEKDVFKDEELYDLIFRSGFSTKDEVTGISGRGVGMDVVKNTVEKLRGTIQVKSIKNKGSSFIIKLPLTLAIFNGMVVDIGNKKLVVPNSEVLQIIDKSKECLCSIDKDNNLLRDGESVYPIISLPKVIGIKTHIDKVKDLPGSVNHSLYLITSDGQKKYAIGINEILGQQKVVLKKLPDNISKMQGISGATILGDGTVSLILDVNKTLKIYNNVA